MARPNLWTSVKHPWRAVAIGALGAVLVLAGLLGHARPVAAVGVILIFGAMAYFGPIP